MSQKHNYQQGAIKFLSRLQFINHESIESHKMINVFAFGTKDFNIIYRKIIINTRNMNCH